jgi:hypothetical protein
MSPDAEQELMLLQLRVLGFGLLEDWDVGVGVFPLRLKGANDAGSDRLRICFGNQRQ